MKLSISTDQFLRVAKRAIQFAEGGRDESGLGLIHAVVTDRGQLRMSAHDTNAGVRTMVDVDDSVPGSVSFVARHLDRVTSVLPRRGRLTLTLAGRARMSLSIDKLKMDMPVRPPEDFPPLPTPPSDGWFETRDSHLSSVVNRCLWASSSESHRPSLMGVHLTHDTAQATDGHAVAYRRVKIMPEGQSVIVPSLTWQKFRSVLGDGGPVHMVVDGDRRLWVRAHSWAVYARLVEGKFPPLSQFVFDPGEDGRHFVDDQNSRHVHWISLHRLEILAVARRIAGVSVSSEQERVGAAVVFKMMGHDLHLVSHFPTEDASTSIAVDEQIDWAEGSVTESDSSGFDCLRHIGVYAHLMCRGLESMTEDVIKFMWTEGEPFMPVQFHEPGMVTMFMPRRV